MRRRSAPSSPRARTSSSAIRRRCSGRVARRPASGGWRRRPVQVVRRLRRPRTSRSRWALRQAGHESALAIEIAAELRAKGYRVHSKPGCASVELCSRTRHVTAMATGELAWGRYDGLRASNSGSHSGGFELRPIDRLMKLPYTHVTTIDRLIHGDCMDNDRNPVVDGKLTVSPR